MQTTGIDVAYVASLARIHLTQEETEAFQRQLEKIVHYVELLKTVDTSSVPDHPIDPHLPTNVLRDDIMRESLPVQEAIRNAPAQTNDLIQTPKIVE